MVGGDDAGGMVGPGDGYGTTGMDGINSNNGGGDGITSLAMLIVAAQETNNPFPFHEKRPINWRTQVRADDKEALKHKRIKIIFKALARQRTIKLLSIAQDLSHTFTHI